MQKIENLSTLKIHRMSQERFESEYAAGNIDETAVYLTPDCSVLYTPQDLSEEQQYQVRENIAAMGKLATSDLDMDGYAISRVGDLTLKAADENWVTLHAGGSVELESGDTASLLEFGDWDNTGVIIRRVVDGINSNDAATVGQLNRAIKTAANSYCITGTQYYDVIARDTIMSLDDSNDWDYVLDCLENNVNIYLKMTYLHSGGEPSVDYFSLYDVQYGQEVVLLFMHVSLAANCVAESITFEINTSSSGASYSNLRSSYLNLTPVTQLSITGRAAEAAAVGTAIEALQGKDLDERFANNSIANPILNAIGEEDPATYFANLGITPVRGQMYIQLPPSTTDGGEE